jgi:hypothetical protein
MSVRASNLKSTALADELESEQQQALIRHPARTVEMDHSPHVKPSDRRAHRRMTPREFQWLRAARVKYGPDVRVIDISSGGMSIETEQQLKPHSNIVFELAGTSSGLVVPSLVLRSQVSALGETVRYRSACSFRRLLRLPNVISPLQRLVEESTDFIKLDLALKSLLDRYLDIARASGRRGKTGAVTADEVTAALESLLAKASLRRSDPLAHLLADVISSLVPVLRRQAPATVVLQELETQLGRTVPQLTVRLSDAPLSPRGTGSESIYFSVGGDGDTPLRVLNVEFPQGFEPDESQFRVLQAGSYLVELLQGWNDLILDAQPAIDAAVPREMLPPSAAPSASTWQKVIARYLDGRLLKGYTSDFNVMRPQLHLSENPCSGDALFVPLTQLKALFFVRDFGGDSSHVEQKVFVTPPQGRKIEVTFVDGEVLVGSTLSYRTEGYGFFVHPADTRGNNIRVFVSSGALRHVRFL